MGEINKTERMVEMIDVDERKVSGVNAWSQRDPRAGPIRTYSQEKKKVTWGGKTTVVLADDHDRVRAGIRSLLERTPDIVVVGEARDGVHALQLVEELCPDVLLLDMEMPGLNGSQVARRLKDSASQVKVLALSAYDDKQYILSLLENGASGYLTKDEAPDALIQAVRGVARGIKGWLSRRLEQKVQEWNFHP